MVQFFSVIDSSCQDFELIQQAFETLIKPVYGAQTAALNKIGAGHDRLCEGLYVDGRLTGMLVYKKQITARGQGLEIKTLALINPRHESGKGLGSVLFDRAVTVARQRKATNLCLTVSSIKPEALSFFQKKGFIITGAVQDRYSAGAVEHELTYQIPALQLTAQPVRDTVHHTASSSKAMGTSIATPPANVNPFRQEHSTHAVVSTGSIQKRSRDEDEEEQRGRNSFVRRDTPPSNTHRPMEHSGRFFGSSNFTESRDRPAPRQHQCTLRDQYIQSIARGQKTYEGRVNTQMFRDYKTGDTATWSSGRGQQVITNITDRREYGTFEAMLRDVGYKNMVPDATSFEHAVSIYKNIPGYQEKATRFGVVALGLEVRGLQQTHSIAQSSAAATGR